MRQLIHVMSGVGELAQPPSPSVLKFGKKCLVAGMYCADRHLCTFTLHYVM